MLTLSTWLISLSIYPPFVYKHRRRWSRKRNIDISFTWTDWYYAFRKRPLNFRAIHMWKEALWTKTFRVTNYIVFKLFSSQPPSPSSFPMKWFPMQSESERANFYKNVNNTELQGRMPEYYLHGRSDGKRYLNKGEKNGKRRVRAQIYAWQR